MPKTTKRIVMIDRLPEWGISRDVSTAVPIAASGAEIKSMRGASNAMYEVLRSRVQSAEIAREELKILRTAISKAKTGDDLKLSFRLGSKKSPSLARKRNKKSSALSARAAGVRTSRKSR
jgi:hypothetical protein